MKAIIIGAGIGGLSAAIALRQAGIEAQVFDRASELKPWGASLSIWTNAVLCLQQLGVGQRLLEFGAPLQVVEFRKQDGTVLATLPGSPVALRLGAPSICIHRADLQEILLQAQEGHQVVLGAELVGLEQRDAGVTARFADGSTARGDVLVGADGLNSAVRDLLLGDAPPRYAGYGAWLATTRLEHPLLPRGLSFECWARDTPVRLTPASSHLKVLERQLNPQA